MRHWYMSLSMGGVRMPPIHPSTQALQPMQGLDRFKKSPPKISVHYLDPTTSDSQPLCIPRHFIHPRFGLPTRLLPFGLSKVIFLHGKLSCILTICPAHLSLVVLIDVTKSVSSYRQYNSSLYRVIHKSLRDFRNSTAQQPRQSRQKGAYQ